MVTEIVPDLSKITEFEVDNAANAKTREFLFGSTVADKRGDLIKTPLGYLMKKLMMECGLSPGEFKYHISPFDVIRIELFVEK